MSDNKLEKVTNTVDKVTNVAEKASNFAGAVKWGGIAVTAVALVFGAVMVKNAVSAPFKAVGSSVEAVSDVVGNSAEGVSDAVGSGIDKASDIINHNSITGFDKEKFSELSKNATTALSGYTKTDPDGFLDRGFRMRKFPGSQGKVCYTSYLTDNGSKINVYAALDNDAFRQSKALGVYDNAHINVTVKIADENTDLNVYYENDEWKSSFSKVDISKSFSKDLAVSVVNSSLEAIISSCK